MLYLIPRTAVLGAILMSGYFGGAIATHVRISDPGLPVALACGILAWIGLYLRDPRVRELVPVRRLTVEAEASDPRSTLVSPRLGRFR